MIFGIKYSGNTRQGIKALNNSMQRYGCAIMLDGKLDYYFNNVFSAIKTAHKLQKAHNGLISYHVFKVEKEYEKRIAIDKILSSYEEYSTIMERKTQETIQKAQEAIHRLDESGNPSPIVDTLSSEPESTM